MTWQILQGDCRDVLRTLPEQSVQTCVTSPPYFGLRDYGTGVWDGGDDSTCAHLVREDARIVSSTLAGGKASTGHQQEGFRVSCPRCGAYRADRQIGLEPTPEEFVAALVEVFRDVRRVLRDDATVWLVLGDSYASGSTPACKPKDLIGIPWMVAFALRADGWYLRSDIVWHKPNPMPESVTDRPTRAHEYLFLLSKGPRYFYDGPAVAEEATHGEKFHGDYGKPGVLRPTANRNGRHGPDNTTTTRNKRSVWTVATRSYVGAHFATFPPKLIEPCILAGSREGDTVLDPFSGAGTTGLVALRQGRSYIGCELSPEYAEMSRWRIIDDAPLFNGVSEVA